MKRHHLHAILLALATFAIYLPALQAGFIWDDDRLLTEGPVFESAHVFWEIWTNPASTKQYYPLVFSSFAIERSLFGLWAPGFHFNNIVLHICNALLVFAIGRRLKIPGAIFIAALFALHPVHTESVTWISERKNVLSGFFYLSSMFVLIPAILEEKRSLKPWLNPWLLGFLLFACALLSKTVTASLPAALLLIRFWRSGDIPLRIVLRLFPFFLLGLGMGLATAFFEVKFVGAPSTPVIDNIPDRFAVAGMALWFYASKLVAPFQLAFFYPRWDLASIGLWRFLPFGLAILFIVGIFASRKKIGRGPFLSLAFFGGTLFPALGFISLYPLRYSFVANHFQYLASLGVLVLLGIALSKNRIIAFVVLTLFAGLSVQENRALKDLESLWTHTLERNPDCFLCMNNLGVLRKREGKLLEAVELWQRSLDTEHDNPEARYNMAVYYDNHGRQDEAFTELKLAVEQAPHSAMIHDALGVAYAARGDLGSAKNHFEAALERNPDLEEAQAHLKRVNQTLVP